MDELTIDEPHMDIPVYMNILNTYLSHNGCILHTQEAALTIYKAYFKNNKDGDLFDKMCGDMVDQVNSLVGSYGKKIDPDIILLLITKNNTPISIFHGTIDIVKESNDHILLSDITCSNPDELRRGGMFLRFYAVLLAKQIDPELIALTGGISGGIPALAEDDSVEVEEAKRTKLIEYHLKHGAKLDEDNHIFTYTLPTIQTQILKLFTIPATIKKRKTIKTKTQKRNTIKSKRLRYTKRKYRMV